VTQETGPPVIHINMLQKWHKSTVTATSYIAGDPHDGEGTEVGLVDQTANSQLAVSSVVMSSMGGGRAASIC